MEEEIQTVLSDPHDDTKSPTGIPHDEIDNSVCSSRSFRVEDILEVNGVKEGEDAIITLRRLGNSGNE